VNPVNKFKLDETPSRHGETPAKQGREKSARKRVVRSRRPMSHPSTTASIASLSEIPGVDFLTAPEPRARAFCFFYPDQIDEVIQAAKRMRDRARPGRIFIAQHSVGFTIYRRRAK
jgi:hypothetical protein